MFGLKITFSIFAAHSSDGGHDGKSMHQQIQIFWGVILTLRDLISFSGSCFKRMQTHAQTPHRHVLFELPSNRVGKGCYSGNLCMCANVEQMLAHVYHRSQMFTERSARTCAGRRSACVQDHHLECQTFGFLSMAYGEVCPMLTHFRVSMVTVGQWPRATRGSQTHTHHLAAPHTHACTHYFHCSFCL